MESWDRYLFLQHSAAARRQGMAAARELLLLLGSPLPSLLTFAGSGLAAGYGKHGTPPFLRGRERDMSRILLVAGAGSFPCRFPENPAPDGPPIDSFLGLVRS